MKKRLIMVLAATACVAVMCGCGTKTDKESQSEVSVSDNATVSDNDAETSVAAQINASDYVTVGEYKGVEISVPGVVEYEDADYDLETKSWYFSYIVETEGVTDRAVELLDMTNIDYEGKKDGVAFDGGTAQGATLLIGSGQFIDGFEEGLIGVMPGETVDLNLTFPETYGNTELAGQDVVFTVTVNFISEMKDEKVGELYIDGVSTVEELRQYVKNYMDEQAKSDYVSSAAGAVLEQVMENSEFAQLPEDLLEENKTVYRNYLEQVAAMYGMDGETYVSTYGGGQDYETIITQYATIYTKESLIAKVIAEQEGLVLTDEELDARIEEYAASAGVTVDYLLTNGATKDNFRESFLYEDVLNFLAENAVNTVSE